CVRPSLPSFPTRRSSDLLRNRPSFYATPVAWAAANFAQLLIEDEGGIVPHHTGMIVVSDECSLSTIRELSRTAAQGTFIAYHDRSEEHTSELQSRGHLVC